MWNIYNGRGQVIDTADTQVEAFGVIDWFTVNAPVSGPFHCAPALVTA